MKRVIMTIDTEGHKGTDPISRLICGEMKNGEKYGVDKIMDICDKYGIRALFFVDMAEAWDYGRDKLSAVIKHIKERGHDVGVHIHPDHMADKKRMFLWEYSRKEQFDIIKKCTDLYTEICGEPPRSFRAGKYGANRDTLDILAELGYTADFSEFYGQKWCNIDPPCAVTSSVRLENGLIEYPVTAYKSFDMLGYRRTDKLDMELPLSEFKHVIKKFCASDDTEPIIMFAHSFSLMKWRRTPNDPRPDRAKCKRLDKMLKALAENKELNILSLEDLVASEPEESRGNDGMISVGGLPAIYFLFRRCLKVVKMNIDSRLRKC